MSYACIDCMGNVLDVGELSGGTFYPKSGNVGTQYTKKSFYADGKTLYLTEQDLILFPVESGSVYYYESYSSHSGKVERVGSTCFHYYDVYSSLGGKLDRIGYTCFFYYQDYDYRKGKIERIGSTFFHYYNSYSSQCGKIERIS